MGMRSRRIILALALVAGLFLGGTVLLLVSVLVNRLDADSAAVTATGSLQSTRPGKARREDWYIQLTIPQPALDRLQRAHEKDTDLPTVDILLVSEPTKVYRGKLTQLARVAT